MREPRRRPLTLASVVVVAAAAVVLGLAGGVAVGAGGVARGAAAQEVTTTTTATTSTLATTTTLATTSTTLGTTTTTARATTTTGPVPTTTPVLPTIAPDPATAPADADAFADLATDPPAAAARPLPESPEAPALARRSDRVLTGSGTPVERDSSLASPDLGSLLEPGRGRDTRGGRDGLNRALLAGALLASAVTGLVLGLRDRAVALAGGGEASEPNWRQ